MTESVDCGRLPGVLLVDDHPMVRRGVRAMIEGDGRWRVLGEAGDGLAALERASVLRPDLVVLDLSMPKVGGIDVIIQLHKMLPAAQVLVLTMQEGEGVMAQALRAGARGYILKTECAERLLPALAALSRGETAFSPFVSDALLQVFKGVEDPGEESRLTPRERQIVKLIAEGHGSRMIADTLKVSLKTVQADRAAAMRKVGAKSPANLTLYAARNELVGT